MDTSTSLNHLWHPVTIGKVVIPGNLFLAPLAGYTDRSFRSICRSLGASFTYTEMVSAEGIARKSHNTEQLMVRGEGEEQFSVQIFMNDASVVLRSLSGLLAFNPTVIDINCGCPVPKVIKTGAGSSLLREPGKIHDIVRVIKDHCDVPVSVKIRTGWDAGSINYHETADAALSAGADMLTMHARTRTMGYSGKADWEALADLKRFVVSRTSAPQYRHVPVFGSGDLFTPADAHRMLGQTGVDGVMFARGAIGNPFIFRDTYRLLTMGETAPGATLLERTEVMRRHLVLLSADIGELSACRDMRKHAVSYLKGIPYAAQTKQELVHARTIADYEKAFADLVGNNGIAIQELTLQDDT
ncbi:MAG: tRNA dihydrouridine synthase DusB [Sphaerochaetaceae bacterium]